MELFRVSLESHLSSSTIYVAGFLVPRAVARTDECMRIVPATTRVVRADLRGVVFIDPSAFVQFARLLNHWRDERHGQILIQFPARSHRPKPAPSAMAYPNMTMGSAVSTATS